MIPLVRTWVGSQRLISRINQVVLAHNPMGRTRIHRANANKLILMRFYADDRHNSNKKDNKQDLSVLTDFTLYPGMAPRPEGPKTVEDFKNPMGEDKNWVSLGGDFYDKENDKFMVHHCAFILITFLQIFVLFLVYHTTDDYRARNWLARESHLELERRQKLSLPLLDPNYADPEKVVLPTEEELEGIYIYV